MILVALAIGLAFLIWGWMAGGWDDADGRMGTGTIITVIAVIAAIIVGGNLYNYDIVYPSKIAILEQNNAEIETKLEKTITAYQTYEKETYTEFKPEPGSDITVAISMYPNLKSDTMVQSLLETYIKNNAEIKELRLKQVYRPAFAFWLYFGGPSAQPQ